MGERGRKKEEEEHRKRDGDLVKLKSCNMFS